MNPWYQMETLMNHMMANPFEGMLGFPSMRSRGALMPFGGFGGGGGGLMPSMDQLFNQMAVAPNCHSFSSSTVVTYTTGQDGQPQVYRSTESTTAAPGGVRETKKTVQDSRSGLQKMSIGHHIRDKAHIIERSRNRVTGEDEELQEFQNLDEEEAETFNQEWEQRISRFTAPRHRYNSINSRAPRREHNHHNRHLAITNGAEEQQQQASSGRKSAGGKTLRFRRETNM